MDDELGIKKPDERIMTQNVGGILVLSLMPALLHEEDVTQQVAEQMTQLVSNRFKLRVLVDLGRVKKISSRMIGHLIQFKKQVVEQDGEAKLYGVRAGLAEIMKANRLDREYEVYADQAAAIKSFKSAKFSFWKK